MKDLQGRLRSLADYLEEQAENAALVRRLSGPSDDEPEAIYIRMFCDKRHESTDEVGYLVNLLREAAGWAPDE